jgi:hypothetical protein
MDEQLSECPFCGGQVEFHQHTEDCRDGCHYIVCKGKCGGFFDFSASADPNNDCETLAALRSAIAKFWNRRVYITYVSAGDTNG